MKGAEGGLRGRRSWSQGQSWRNLSILSSSSRVYLTNHWFHKPSNVLFSPPLCGWGMKFLPVDHGIQWIKHLFPRCLGASTHKLGGLGNSRKVIPQIGEGERPVLREWAKSEKLQCLKSAGQCMLEQNTTAFGPGSWGWVEQPKGFAHWGSLTQTQFSTGPSEARSKMHMLLMPPRFRKYSK